MKSIKSLANGVVAAFAYLSVVVAAPSGAPFTEGLVAYYPFNGNARDESGSGNHGVVYGAQQAADRFGRPQSAYSFDASARTNYVRVEDSPSLHLSTATISLWMSLQAGPLTHVVSKDFVNGGTCFHLSGGHVEGPAYWQFGVGRWGVGEAVAQWDQALETNRWHHVVGTYDGARVRLFVNGQLRATADYTAGLDTDNGMPLVIGQKNYGVLGSPQGNYQFAGLIDDVRIYNRALAPGEIEALFSAEGSSGTDTDQDGLPDLWEEQIVSADDRDSIWSIADVLPEHDFDFDGRNNALEYAEQTSPVAPDRCFPISNDLAERLRRNQSALDQFLTTNVFSRTWVTNWTWRDFWAEAMAKATTAQSPGTLVAHPQAYTIPRIYRLVEVPLTGAPALTLSVNPFHDTFLCVVVNTSRVWQAQLSAGWQKVLLDLRPWAGRKIQLEVINTIGGPLRFWYFEHVLYEEVDVVVFPEPPSGLVAPSLYEDTQTPCWFHKWTFSDNGGAVDNGGLLPVTEFLDGKSYVVGTVPLSPSTPCVIEQRAAIPCTSPWLRMVARGADDFLVKCFVDDQLVFTNIVGPVGWTTMKVDLSRWADSLRTVRIEHWGGGQVPWSWEHAIWADIQVGSFIAPTIRVSQVELSWETCTNTLYQIQYRDVLAAGPWFPLGAPVVGTGGRFSTNDVVLPGQAQRYYQVITTTGP